MADPRKPFLQTVLRACSRILLWTRAVVFLFGDAFLYEIKHVKLLLSSTIGILGGLLLMFLGAGIAVASKSPKSGQRLD